MRKIDLNRLLIVSVTVFIVALILVASLNLLKSAGPFWIVLLPMMLVGLIIFLAVFKHFSNSDQQPGSQEQVLQPTAKKENLALQWTLTIGFFVVFYFLLLFVGHFQDSDKLELFGWLSLLFSPVILSLFLKTFSIKGKQAAYFFIGLLTLIIFAVCIWSLIH